MVGRYRNAGAIKNSASASETTAQAQPLIARAEEKLHYSTLIARVEEGAAGPDRELDAMICAAIRYVPKPRYQYIAELRYDAQDDGSIEAFCTGDDGVERRVERFPSFVLLTSLDAILSLIEQKLPGWSWEAGAVNGKRGWCAMCDEESRVHIGSNAASPARALLSATLRALSALEDSKADLADATNGDRP